MIFYSLAYIIVRFKWVHISRTLSTDNEVRYSLSFENWFAISLIFIANNVTLKGQFTGGIKNARCCMRR